MVHDIYYKFRNATAEKKAEDGGNDQTASTDKNQILTAADVHGNPGIQNTSIMTAANNLLGTTI